MVLKTSFLHIDIPQEIPFPELNFCFPYSQYESAATDGIK
jgi:hypothetical protein